MPIKRIQFPDGSIKRVEVPEGATDQQILDFVQSSYKPQPKADFSQVSANSGSSAIPGAGRKVRKRGGLAQDALGVVGSAIQRAKVIPMLAPGVMALEMMGLGQDKPANSFAGGRGTLENFAYGAATPMADTVVGLSQMTGIGSKEWQDNALARIDSVRRTTPGKAGTVAGEVAMLAVPSSKVAKAPSIYARVAGNTALGGLVGGTRGVREGESRGMNAGVGAAAAGIGGLAGDAIGAGVRNVRGIIDPFTQRGQQRIAAMTIKGAATNPNNLGRVAPSAVPGVHRTLAEETIDPGIGQLQRQFPQQFADLGRANNNARADAVRGAFHGADEDAALAIESARDEAAERTLAGLGDVLPPPKPENPFSGLGVSVPKAANPARTGGMIDIAPVANKAASLISKNQNSPTLTRPLEFIRGLLQKGVRSAEDAYRIRKEIGYLMDGKLNGDMPAADAAKRELLSLRDALDDQMSQAFPEWGQYLNSYRAESTRAGQARVGAAILNNARQGADPETGVRMMTGNDLARTVNGIDGVVSKATGFRHNTAANTLTGEQRGLISALGDDANRMIDAQGFGRASGSDSVNNLNTQALLSNAFGGSPSPLARLIGQSQPVQRLVLSPVQKTLGLMGVPERLQSVTIELLRNPQQARTALAALNASDRAAVQRAMAAMGGAGGAIASPAFASPPSQ